MAEFPGKYCALVQFYVFNFRTLSNPNEKFNFISNQKMENEN